MKLTQQLCQSRHVSVVLLLTYHFHPVSPSYSWQGAIELFTGAVKKISAEVAIPGRHGSDTNRALIERLEAYYKDL